VVENHQARWKATTNATRAGGLFDSPNILSSQLRSIYGMDAETLRLAILLHLITPSEDSS
jgi:hypothetical protein